MRLKSLFLSLVLLAGALSARAQDRTVVPTRTCLYAEKDTSRLLLDYYAPAPDCRTYSDGTRKPTILYVFGGGFVMGSRDDLSHDAWFRRLTDDGYGVVSIDYRLGLRGQKVSITHTKPLERAIQMAVEDLFDATAWLLQHAAELDIDPDGIVLAGSSAGAITILQADWELANASPSAAVLPPDFRYAGVMSFSGAIYSTKGSPSYAREPAPTLFLHGTADRIVTYKRIKFLRRCFAGTDALVRIFAKAGFNYNVLRFKDNHHEICISMLYNYDEEMRFLRDIVVRGEKKIVDMTIDDPSIESPSWAVTDFKAIYD